MYAMKKIKAFIGTTLLAGFIVFLSAGISTAAYITQTQYFTSSIPDFEEIFTFNQYNNGYDLESVEIVLDLDITGGWLGVDNDGASATTVTVKLGATGSISSTDVALVDAAFQPVFGDVDVFGGTTYTLEANDGDGTGNVDLTAPDGATYTGVSQSGSDSGFINSFVFDGYTGAGTFDITATVNSILDLGSTGGVEGSFGPVTVESGSVTVIYGDSAPVPEPSAMLLLGFGLIGLLGIGKKKFGK
jgi:hypothetical protein